LSNFWLDALALENMNDKYLNVVAVKTVNKDSELAKNIQAVIESVDFEKSLTTNLKASENRNG
jgi:D-methionine transport system substrate-binding protein